MNSTMGRVAVVTGANKGIGFFIALKLGLTGLFHHVVLACRDLTRGSQATASIRAQLPPEVIVHCAQLDLGDMASHEKLFSFLDKSFGKLDVLVNNAAMAFKGADPTPFQRQTKPTLDINFRATVDLTERLIPLLQKGQDPRIVNVASMAGRLSQLSPQLQQQFSAPDLTITNLQQLVDQFEQDVQNGVHRQKGWSNSNYGLSKLALIAATKIWARDYPNIAVNCCCPGACKTDMSSQRGSRDPQDGAYNAVLPATVQNPPTGQFYENYKVSRW